MDMQIPWLPLFPLKATLALSENAMRWLSLDKGEDKEDDILILVIFYIFSFIFQFNCCYSTTQSGRTRRLGDSL
jgi:hypothetical protein